MTSPIGRSAGRFESLPSLLAWLRAAPAGTVMPCDSVLNVLERLDHAPSLQADQESSSQGSAVDAGWREKIWTAPAETRLGIAEAAEALGRPRSFIYRRTSAKSSLSRIPHRKLDGGLVFLAGELRSWLASQEELVVESDVAPCSRARRTRA